MKKRISLLIISMLALVGCGKTKINNVYTYNFEGQENLYVSIDKHEDYNVISKEVQDAFNKYNTIEQSSETNESLVDDTEEIGSMALVKSLATYDSKNISNEEVAEIEIDLSELIYITDDLVKTIKFVYKDLSAESFSITEQIISEQPFRDGYNFSCMIEFSNGVCVNFYTNENVTYAF